MRARDPGTAVMLPGAGRMLRATLVMVCSVSKHRVQIGDARL
jgi:hypothetical protein